MPTAANRPRDLVLVGAGHSHIQVLRRFAMAPPERVQLTLVVDTPTAVYSGMVPGFVAGQYRPDELEIDALPLARRAGARVIVAPATGIDAAERRLEIEGRPPIRYDRISFDIGSTVAGLELPGVRDHAFPTRPIGLFVRRIDDLLQRGPPAEAASPRIVVVGGGAGGVELAFCLDQRLRREGRTASVDLLESGRRILAGYPSALVRRVERRAAQRGIRILCRRRVEAVEHAGVRIDGGQRVASDLTVWVTGAVSQSLFRDSGLPTDARGFVRVRSTLQVEGHDEIFAVGDCATLIEHPDTPKAGVYAVRQGPYIAGNLRAALAGDRLRAYRPQGDFLTLLNLGDGSALGAKWGRSVEGEWVMRLKDRIDRRFMRRFQVLRPEGGLTAEFAAQPEMAQGGPMLCGGCAAKLGQSRLERVLDRLGPPPADPSVELGLDRPDDAAAWRVGGGRRAVATVDVFRGFTDDPYLVGRVGAVNALSDLWAKGVRPRWAMAVVALPETAPGEADEETLFQVLAGARSILDAEGVTLVGGHTTTAADLLVGFTAEGLVEADRPLLRLDGLRPGQRLILTKPLGTGVLLHADLRGLARGPWLEAALSSMQRPNAAAARVAVSSGATGSTDVTGFGLAGHLAAMARASGVGAALALEPLPTLAGALELLDQGVRSTSHAENSRLRGDLSVEPEAAASARLELLFDPQTAGGLLFGVPAERAGETLERLHEVGERQAAVVAETFSATAETAPIAVRLRW